MKMSEITLFEVLNFLKLDDRDIDEGERTLLGAYLSAAKDYVKSYTGLTDEACDKHETLAIAVLILCSDMYENRTKTLSSSVSAPNKTLDAMLGFYAENLIA